MDTTTLDAFWGEVASSTTNMIWGNNMFWISLVQVILILSLLSALSIVIMSAIKKIFGKRRKG